jgi:hypothetical protein
VPIDAFMLLVVSDPDEKQNLLRAFNCPRAPTEQSRPMRIARCCIAEG